MDLVLWTHIRYADFEKVYLDLGMGWNDPSVPRGNIGAFRILKQMHPHLKIAFSLGGWTLSE